MRFSSGPDDPAVIRVSMKVKEMAAQKDLQKTE